VPQQYLPESVLGRRYYEPSDHGAEAKVKERLRRRASDPEDIE
jgi:replication-associated recombination protein RarA